MQALQILTILLVMLQVSLPHGVRSQNLVRNCELEQMSGCPTAHGQITRCKYYESPGQGTTDYLHACNQGSFGVPSNQFGSQAARSGDAYANIISYYPPNGQYREYLQTRLACTLQEGKAYEVSFYVSCADDSHYGIDALGAHFTVDKLVQPGDDVIELGEEVHISNPAGFPVIDKDGWVKVHGIYVARGGEKYITIGNFLRNDEVTVHNFTSWNKQLATYYVDDVSVECMEPIIDLGPDTVLCPNDSLVIDLSDICLFTSLEWEDGTVDPVRTITQAGTYSVAGTLGCSDFYDNITVSYTYDPGQFLPPDTVICPGQVLDIIPLAGFESYLWNDGSSEPTLTTEVNGIFWLMAGDEYGCSFRDSITVSNLSAPSFFLGHDTLLCLGQSITLDPGIDSMFHYFLWSDQSTGTSVSVSDSGVYWLRITNPCGEMSDTIRIRTYNCDPALAAPNAFTPNADGKNDIFALKTENISDFSIFIYDRWGTMVFEGRDPGQGWDGKYKGQPCPAGTYLWVAAYRDDEGSGGRTNKIKGVVVLLR